MIMDLQKIFPQNKKINDLKKNIFFLNPYEIKDLKLEMDTIKACNFNYYLADPDVFAKYLNRWKGKEQLLKSITDKILNEDSQWDRLLKDIKYIESGGGSEKGTNHQYSYKRDLRGLIIKEAYINEHLHTLDHVLFDYCLFDKCRFKSKEKEITRVGLMLFYNSNQNNCRFSQCIFDNASFWNKNLKNTVFYDCTFNNITFNMNYDGEFNNILFQNCTFNNVNFEKVDLREFCFWGHCKFNNLVIDYLKLDYKLIIGKKIVN